MWGWDVADLCVSVGVGLCLETFWGGVYMQITLLVERNLNDIDRFL